VTKRAFRIPGTLCAIDGCTNEEHLRGWCAKHYYRFNTYGDPLAPIRHASDAASFWARTKPDGSCLIWTKGLNQGYGRLRWNGKVVQAHRLAFFLRLGRWPDGELRHLCNRRECILHAVEGTRTENMQDKVEAGTARNMAKDFCKWGHAHDAKNTIISRDGYRRGCRACARLAQAARRSRLRAMSALSTGDLI